MTTQGMKNFIANNRSLITRCAVGVASVALVAFGISQCSKKQSAQNDAESIRTDAVTMIDSLNNANDSLRQLSDESDSLYVVMHDEIDSLQTALDDCSNKGDSLRNVLTESNKPVVKSKPAPVKKKVPAVVKTPVAQSSDDSGAPANNSGKAQYNERICDPKGSEVWKTKPAPAKVIPAQTEKQNYGTGININDGANVGTINGDVHNHYNFDKSNASADTARAPIKINITVKKTTISETIIIRHHNSR